jgi:hypothetical protein
MWGRDAVAVRGGVGPTDASGSKGSTGKRSGPVGAVMFSLRSGLKEKWINSDLPDNTAGWRSEWFYIVDQFPGLPRRTGHKPVKISE